MTPAPLPDDVADAGWRAIKALSALLQTQHQIGSALTTENARQKLVAQVFPALDAAHLAARLFVELAETELKRRDPHRG